MVATEQGSTQAEIEDTTQLYIGLKITEKGLVVAIVVVVVTIVVVVVAIVVVVG